MEYVILFVVVCVQLGMIFFLSKERPDASLYVKYGNYIVIKSIFLVKGWDSKVCDADIGVLRKYRKKVIYVSLLFGFLITHKAPPFRKDVLYF